MRLTKEHVGKWVRRTNWNEDSSSVKVLDVDEAQVFVYDPDRPNDRDSIFDPSDTEGEWEIDNCLTQEGLSLLEAMRSGKDFREIGSTDRWYNGKAGILTFADRRVDEHDPLLITKMLTDRYELKPDPEPKKVEITAEMFDTAWKAASSIYARSFCEGVKKALGLL